MKNTNRNTLSLRAHSVRNLTTAELRIAHGGDGTGNGTGQSQTCCGHSHRTR